MIRKLIYTIGLITGFSFASVANATVCPANTWCFGGNPALVAQGSTYSIGLGTITVDAAQVSGAGQTNITSTSDATINGLFQTNDSTFDEGIGIAPYNPSEGGSPFSSQDGITDTNVLELQLGSNIANGTTLKFLLQAGIGYSTDSITVYTEKPTSHSATPVNLTAMNVFDNSLAVPILKGMISTNGTAGWFSLTKDTSGTEFVAIQADCHYLLLDTITGTPPSGVPEPRFYGLLLASMLGLAGIYFRNRKAAQSNA